MLAFKYLAKIEFSFWHASIAVVGIHGGRKSIYGRGQSILVAINMR